MARRPRQWWWRSCQAKAPENIPRRPAIRVSRLRTKPAHVPVHHSRHEASDDLLPALLGDRLGLGLAHGWSRLRHRLGRNAIAGECRKDGIARRLTGCHLIGLLRRYGNGFHLWKAIRLRRWDRGCAFLLGGWLDSRRRLRRIDGLLLRSFRCLCHRRTGKAGLPPLGPPRRQHPTCVLLAHSLQEPRLRPRTDSLIFGIVAPVHLVSDGADDVLARHATVEDDMDGARVSERGGAVIVAMARGE